MFYFLQSDTRKQKKYEMRTQTSVDNTVNNLRYEIKFENCVKDKSNFFIKRFLIKLVDWIIKNDNVNDQAILFNSPQHGF